jgi:hypothetical protein
MTTAQRKRLLTAPRLIDGFGRAVTYLRVSVTDRCDLRCVYCMAEHMTFLPKAEVLTLEELDRLASTFVGLGVRKLRLTGGEPLVRKGFMDLVAGLSRHLRSGALDELTLTTNGTQLEACRGSGPPRRAADQRLARHPEARPLQAPDPGRRPGPGDRRDRRGPGGRHRGQDQRRGPQADNAAELPALIPGPTRAAAT